MVGSGAVDTVLNFANCHNLQESLGKAPFNEFGDVIDLFGDSRDSEEDIMDIMAKVREINDNAIDIA